MLSLGVLKYTMKKLNFLSKLKREKKLKLVEESREISQSYLIKSDNCLRSAKVLFKEKLFENSVTESYYGMYNSVLALLFRCGIKCENHTAAIMLLRKIYNLPELQRSILNAKKERIDKQYYVTAEKKEAPDAIAELMIRDAEQFIIKIRIYLNRLNSSDIVKIRKLFDDM